LTTSESGTYEAEGFYFLPPIVDEVPTIEGTFNEALLPSLRVCELDGLPGPTASCREGDPIVVLPPGSSTVDGERYEIAWDTDGPETGTISPYHYYRLEILVAGEVLGWRDLDPSDPDVNESTAPGTFGFHIGETIPIAFWLGAQLLCEGETFVTECIATAVIDETGGTLVLDEQGDKLAVTIFEGSLPGENADPITVTVERIDPDLFFSQTGTACLPLFDAPQFADCFRVTTIPELTVPLDSPALVSICLDPTVLEGIDLPGEQENQLTMVRYNEEQGGIWEALPDVAGDCPEIFGSFLPVPRDGVFRYAALGINAVVDLLAPEPLAARDIRLGGLTSSFSRFRYALPGQMVAAAGDGELLQSGQSEVQAVVDVVDSEGLPVENAIVHFETTDGTVSSSEAVTDATGSAQVTWTVDVAAAGQKALTVSALGLVTDEVPEHSEAYFFTTEELIFTATVVGPPASIGTSPDSPITGGAGESAGDLTVTVDDAAGNPVSGASVTWEGDGEIVGGSVTDADGMATAEWILPTTAGPGSVTATVGGVTATFTAEIAPGAPANLTREGDGITASAGSTVPISVTVTDAFGNAVPDEDVEWSVTLGGGTVVGASATDPGGMAEAAWTLGEAPGTNHVRVTAGGLETFFSVTVACARGYGTANPDGDFGAGEWACADSLDFQIPGKNDATVYWMNDAENIYFAVRVEGGSSRNAESLRITFDNDGDGRTEYRDDVIGYDTRHDIVVDNYLGRRCARSRGRSDCSSRDRMTNVVGAVSADGTYTTYELSHPLSGDRRGQDLVRAAGDPLGFFLTLHNGRGAWGGTNFPGFRDYYQITIAGPG